MKDIFKFIFTFSGSEKIIKKTNDEKRKILNNTLLILIIFIGGIGTFVFWLFLGPFTLLLSLSIPLYIIFFGAIKFLFFRILKLKNTFLDACYFTLIIFLTRILSIIGMIFLSENFFIINTIIFFFWAFTIDFILMKKLTNNLFSSIICSILFTSVLFYNDILRFYNFYLNNNYL